MTKPIVEIHDYDPGWANEFEREKQKIGAILGNHALAIEHIGSTSVKGLASKPIIDIMVGMANLESALSFAKSFRKIGYEYVPIEKFKDRLFFRKGLWRQGTCHLHICEFNGSEWKDMLLFRDYLRAHPEAAAEYASLKQLLAAKHTYERSTYTKEKEPFIKKILMKGHVESE
ncbi:GrpB family protein [Pradoshia sp.]